MRVSAPIHSNRFVYNLSITLKFGMPFLAIECGPNYLSSSSGESSEKFRILRPVRGMRKKLTSFGKIDGRRPNKPPADKPEQCTDKKSITVETARYTPLRQKFPRDKASRQKKPPMCCNPKPANKYEVSSMWD